MKIEKRKLETLKPYVNNAKEHPDWQIEQIKESIERFGFNDPIAIDEQGNIIEGHGRYLASIQLGLEEVDCIVLGHLTELEKKAYIIAHNKLTRSEEHTSELQSRQYLVCRLLLEKSNQ